MSRHIFLAGVCALLGAACNGPNGTITISDMGGQPDAVAAADGSTGPVADTGGPEDTGGTATLPDGGPQDLAMPDASATDVGGADLPPDMSMPGSAGCQTGNGIAEGVNTFMLEGRERRFIMRLPSGYTRDRAWPLVFALHGNGGSASYWDGTSGDRNIRGVLQDDAILVVAEAIEGNWRDYNADPSTWPERIESELLYFDTIIEQAKAELCIDETAIFSMGFSGGGSFSGVLGCRRTDIRAIAVGGSVIYFDEANCVGTPAAWITIGTQELTTGREAYRDFFRDRAGCEATSSATTPDPCVAYDGCAVATPVHYCQHPDGHIWPSFGSQAMWDFFAQFVGP